MVYYMVMMIIIISNIITLEVQIIQKGWKQWGVGRILECEIS